MVRICCVSAAGITDGDYWRLYERATPARQQRAGEYRNRADALRCILADALLRYALGEDTFTVETGEYGKPYIRERPDFHYNLSHSGDWVVIAWADTPVGVDIQKMQWDEKKLRLLRRCFTAEEQTYVLEGEEGIQDRFYEIWTKKESYLKYLGTGIRSALNSFSVLPEGNIPVVTEFPVPGYCLSLCAADTRRELTFVTRERILGADT